MVEMKWLLTAVAAALVGLTAAFAASAAPPAVVLPTPATVASWPGSGSFAESMTLGSDGHLYVSRTIWGDKGLVERVGGAPWSAEIEVGDGLLTGIAQGPDGLYVGVASFATSPANGVVRLDAARHATYVATLPPDVFPNGLAFSGGYLYVTDPDHGAIYRVAAGARDVPLTQPWLQDNALAPTKALGVNGIAFRHGTMYLAQYDRGQILKTQVAGDSAGPLEVMAQDPALKTADGIAFDPLGNLWVAANGTGPSKSGRLLVVTPGGEVATAAAGVSWLDYPTQPVFAPGGLFVVDGSFGLGSPGVVGWRF